jgi:hypothetical protein
MTELDSQPNGIPKRGYLLDFLPTPDQVQHEFCGIHNIEGGTCPNCKKPLLRLLSLSARDPVLSIDPAKTPVVHLVYCWTCSIPYGQFSYKVNPDESIDLIQVPERDEYEFGSAGPYDGYTGIYPLRKVRLVPAEELAAMRDENEREDPAHQIGGDPFIANPEDVTCPLCLRASPLFATICDDAAGNNPWKQEESSTFNGNGGVQMIFHFCRDCGVISAYHCYD